MNNVNLAGRLTADPDRRYDSNGRAATLVPLAVSDERTADSDVVFLDILVYDAAAQTAADRLRKGQLIAVEGRLAPSEGADQHQRVQKNQVVAVSLEFIDSTTSPTRRDLSSQDQLGDAIDKILVTPDEAARALAIGRSKIYELLGAGELDSIRIGNSRRIPIDAINRFIAERRHAPRSSQ